jgi:anti-sigma factor RsiW
MPAMNDHLSDDVLERFTAGRSPTGEAVQAARHIDECAGCAMRALALDPLAPAFASVDDPPLPEGLESAVLDAASRPVAPAVPAWPAAGALLASAALLLAVGSDPTAALVAAGRLATTLLVTGGALGHLLPQAPLVLAGLAVLGLASSVAAFGLLRPLREAP